MTKIVIKNLEQAVELLRRADNIIMDAMDEAEKEEATYDIYDDLVEPSNTLGDIRSEIDNILGRCRKIKDSNFKDKDPRPVSEIAEHLNAWIDAFLDNDDELSEEYEKPFRNIQKDKRLLNKVASELKTQFDALDIDLNNLEDAPDISRIIWKEMKRFTRR